MTDEGWCSALIPNWFDHLTSSSPIDEPHPGDTALDSHAISQQAEVSHDTTNLDFPLVDTQLVIPNTDLHPLELFHEPKVPKVFIDLFGGYDVPFQASPSTVSVMAAGSLSLEPTDLGATLSPHATGLSSVPSDDVSALPFPSRHHTSASRPSQLGAGPNRVRYPCPYPGCSKSYSHHPDMRRHAASHNAAATILFCHHSGCPRKVRGFSRRDKLSAHVKAVHGG